MRPYIGMGLPGVADMSPMGGFLGASGSHGHSSGLLGAIEAFMPSADLLEEELLPLIAGLVEGLGKAHMGGAGQGGGEMGGCPPGSMPGGSAGGGYSPGGGSGAGSSEGGSGAGSSQGGGSTPVGSAGMGNNVVAYASKFLGQRASNLSGLPNYSRVGCATDDCAEFVCSVLQDTGAYNGPHTASVNTLYESLLKQGYHKIPQSMAMPGDVWIDGSMSGHTEIVSAPGGAAGIGANGDAVETVSNGALPSGGIVLTRR